MIAAARSLPASVSDTGPYGRWDTRSAAASFCTISVTVEGASPSVAAS